MATETAQRVEQLSAEDLHRMFKERRYAEIDRARLAGQFDELLGQQPKKIITGQWTQQDLDEAYAHKDYAAIDQAHINGQMNNLLGAESPEA